MTATENNNTKRKTIIHAVSVAVWVAPLLVAAGYLFIHDNPVIAVMLTATAVFNYDAISDND